MAKYIQGKFVIKNTDKYIGKKQPTYRSSWEFTFMNFCDNNPNILQWASEAIHVNYRNPFTKKNTIYVPDFLIIYVDAQGVKRGEVIEVKPSKESMLGANGSLDSLIYIKKPIYIKPTNSIPNVYGRGIGQEVNFNGSSKDTTPTNIQSACKSSMNKRKAMGQSSLPVLPYT